MKSTNLFTLTVIFLSLISLYSKSQTFTVNEKTANNALMNYFKNNNITNNKDKVFQTSQVKIGDLNNDKKNDAVVRYVLGLNIGNAITGNGIVVFLNTGNSLKFLTDYQEKPDAILKSITNCTILLEILNFGPNDPTCCPSIKSNAKLKLENNILTEIK